MTKLRLFNLLVGVAILTFIFSLSGPGEVWRVLKNVDLKFVLLCLLLNLPIVLLAPLRSSLAFRRLGYPIAARVLVPSTILGFVAGAVTPAASGEILRGGALRLQAGIPMQETLSLVVYERVLSSYLLVLSTGVFLAFSSLSLFGGVLISACALALVLLPWLVGLYALPLLPRETAIRGAGRLAAGSRYVLGMVARVRILLRDSRLLLSWSLVTLIMFALIAVQYWLLARGVSSGISLREAGVAFGVSQLAAIISLVPLGLGVGDGSLAAVLNRLGLTLEQGAVVAVLVRAAITLPLLIAAFACYLDLQRRPGVYQSAADERRALTGPRDE
jgi:uncharacterized protein (TIRG00374 family)